ncbi:hypothetical protein EJF18_80238 [Clavispora lusitaniae]|uniref:Uncharacterized protein n=1 Tax=Clavispora lusitaniae TaxID=36911 RepID=A0ACD0WSZ6_CLALS|nr:hypothetical protein EJF14_80238 [Clavispora lusitaniae]QFZ36181.1 hypothetical protein EJF16_80238 [Clavispora lusitaniae]QFZ41865.1 hypothetical protein EJF15_80238 [Clavispora lusitaniae]QFZ47541.1 hypothetical protein EJF18_80238 [Clavispora lusitaniae]QFZ53220.1 hypothetical protein EJF17_80238 [Clavispora lusitaniae]
MRALSPNPTQKPLVRPVLVCGRVSLRPVCVALADERVLQAEEHELGPARRASLV